MSVISVNQKLATELGLNYDRESGIVAGFYNGYHIAFIMQNNLRQIIVSVSNGTGQMPEKEILKQAHKENKKVLSNPSVQGYRATYAIPNAMTDNGKLERSAAAAAVLTEFLKANCLRDCSELSGRPDESSCYYVSGGLRFLTRDEYDTERNRAQSSFNEQNSKRGNPIAGIVGALIGSFAGLVVMVLIGQLGYVSPWTGLVMGVCVAKGYELLSGKFDTVGLVCSILIMVGMTYLGNQLDWAITIARAYEANVFDAFPVVNEVVKANELLPVYYRNLALYYFAMLCGALPTIYGLMKNRQLLNVSYPIGPEAHEEVVYVSSNDETDSE
ncbi:FUSC family protein [Stomatobaculum longum]|uniref:FUSC family protein n=1 Tax=Stomatobaculum longum TaxID=796942 RepID=UPI003C76AEB4